VGRFTGREITKSNGGGGGGGERRRENVAYHALADWSERGEKKWGEKKWRTPAQRASGHARILVCRYGILRTAPTILVNH